MTRFPSVSFLKWWEKKLLFFWVQLKNINTSMFHMPGKIQKSTDDSVKSEGHVVFFFDFFCAGYFSHKAKNIAPQNAWKDLAFLSPGKRGSFFQVPTKKKSFWVEPNTELLLQNGGSKTCFPLLGSPLHILYMLSRLPFAGWEFCWRVASSSLPQCQSNNHWIIGFLGKIGEP